MKLNELLIESNHEQKIPKYRAESYIKSKCAAVAKTPLYRGGSGRFDAAIITASEYPHERVSKTRDSLALDLVSKLPSWAAYPPRTRSIFMTNSLNIANNWGKVYECYPVDSARIAVAPSYDFNHAAAFPYAMSLYKGRRNIGIVLSEVIYSISNTARNSFDDDVFWDYESRSVDDIKNIDRHITRADYGIMELLVNTPLASGSYNTLWEVLDDLLNPEKNNYKLITPAEYSTHYQNSKDLEFWTDSPTVMILKEEK